jgi:hypothetical protein
VYRVNSDGENKGNVDMTEDFPLVSGLPLRQMAFKGPLRYQIGEMQ